VVDQRLNDTGRAIEYQQREWTTQRIAWVIMTMTVVAAFLGLLGDTGPLAVANATAPDGSLQARYTRFAHHHGPGTLTVEVAPASVVEGEVRLLFEGDFVRDLGVESVVPEPDRVELVPDGVVYVFVAEEPSSPLVVHFSYEHDGYWFQSGQFGIEGAEPVVLSLFVFP
jgi:hypothetical protein